MLINRRHCPSARADQRGVVMVEAAIGITVLLMLMVAGIEALHIGYLNMGGQYAVAEAARWAAYGEVLPGQSNRLDSVKEVIRRKASTYGLEIQPSQIKVCPGVERFAACNQESELTSNSTFTIQVVHPTRTVLLKELAIDLHFRAVAQNEPF